MLATSIIEKYAMGEGISHLGTMQNLSTPLCFYTPLINHMDHVPYLRAKTQVKHL